MLFAQSFVGLHVFSLSDLLVNCMVHIYSLFHLLFQEFRDYVTSKEVDHVSMKDSFETLLAIASEQDITRGVETSQNKHSNTDTRWSKLKANCEEHLQSIKELKNLFDVFEEKIEVVNRGLDQVENELLPKVAVGTDSKKTEEEIEHIKVSLIILHIF